MAKLKTFDIGIMSIFLFFLLTACSNIKPYNKSLPHNITIKTINTSSSIIKTVHTAIDIYFIDSSCKLKYEGSIEVDAHPKKIGLVKNKYSYLVFRFKTGGLLSNSKSSIHTSGYLSPHPGFQYSIAMSYRDSIYNVIVTESRKGRKTHEIELKEQNPCN